MQRFMVRQCLALLAVATACGGDDTTGTGSASDTDATTMGTTMTSATDSTTVSTTDSTTVSTTQGTDTTDATTTDATTTGATTTGATTGDDCCDPLDQPQCFEGSTCCDDGSWACNDDGGNPTCDEGVVCEAPTCCDENRLPPCVEGPAMCCDDGSWMCPDEGGQCPGQPGDVCPGADCCDPNSPPPCAANLELTCCADGWACLDKGGVCAPGIVCDGPDCQPQMGSCAQGESCCDGLDCCAGNPIPQGQEYCGQMCPVSDRNRKRDFETIDPAAVLEKVVAMPITEWSYKFEDSNIRHIGPMAQDFRAAFGVGKTEKLIFQVDADGVALASIQALHAEIEQLKDDKTALQATLSTLERRLTALEGSK